MHSFVCIFFSRKKSLVIGIRNYGKIVAQFRLISQIIKGAGSNFKGVIVAWQCKKKNLMSLE